MTVGIIMDDYKVIHFEQGLKEEGLSIIDKTPNAPGLTLVKIEVEEKDLNKVKSIIETIDNQAKATKN